MTSLSLQRIQADFQEYVLGARKENPAIATMIADQFGLPADDRLAIYYDAYRIRLRDALSEAFSKTRAYVGDDTFIDLSNGYIEKYPSRYRNLRWFGDAFPAFVAQALPDYPVAAELASFEWALGLAFDAADAPVLSAEDVRHLGADDWEHIGFVLHPSQQFLTMQWNVPVIWLALEKEDAPPEALCTEAASCWLIWRKDLQAHFRSLTPCEALALQGLARGLSFARVCADAADSSDEDITHQIGGWLHRWLSESVVAGINRACVER